MSSHNKEEPREYRLILTPKSDIDLISLMEEIKKNEIIPIYIALTLPRVADYAAGKRNHLAEIIIKKGE